MTTRKSILHIQFSDIFTYTKNIRNNYIFP